MTRRFDNEVLADRARDLDAKGLNGLRLVFVELLPAATPDHAVLDVEFHNDHALAAIDAAINGGGLAPTDVFVIEGGTRIVGGTATGQVQVTAVAQVAPNHLQLTVAPIGDYSTYTLGVAFPPAPAAPLIDPLFGKIDFKFRPGCFNLNCAPSFTGEAAAAQPDIDYLAKDFHSFKHLLINAMRERVPGWEPTSEADFDQVVLDLIAADGDELSDFQDRVMSEAYLGLARKRVSLARHARLMDYHIHQGNQASTWLAVQVSSDAVLPQGFGVWTGERWQDADAIFITGAEQACLRDLDTLSLYTWDEAVLSLDAGSTQADLALPAPLDPTTEAAANTLRDHFRRDDITHLVIEEKLNPQTGEVPGRNLRKRQLLRLSSGDAAAETGFDPAAGRFYVTVHWIREDRLRERYCFVSRCSGQPPTVDVSMFHGNLVQITHGRPHLTVFRPPGALLGPSDDVPFVRLDERHHEATPWGVLCTLPHRRLAYRNTPAGGDVPTRSTAQVVVGGMADPWLEQSDLIESQSDDEHFIVETDELACSRLRFGNGVNGRPLDPDDVVTCAYQVGLGSEGNVGADRLTGFGTAVPEVDEVHNPFDVVDGRDPEPAAEIIRRVPEAYRARQLRAVTLQDYVDRAEELEDVSHAAARYAWTGSWRTVQVAIDPVGTTLLSELARERIDRHLNAVRLMGEDLEVRPARYIPLDIRLVVCVRPDVWPNDLEAELEMEFSDGYTADGRLAFFHPDAWTFGQDLHASQIIGRALAVQGVERVVSLSMQRWNPASGATSVIVVDPEDVLAPEPERIELDPFEIVQVANDPDHLEHGRMVFELRGGRG